MAGEIKVHFQAKNSAALKYLIAIYNEHLVLNEIAVRLNQQTGRRNQLDQDEVKRVNHAFNHTVALFSKIIGQYGNLENFVDNFAGLTKDWAQRLIIELVDFNNGFANLNEQKGVKKRQNTVQISHWLDRLMTEIVNANEVFQKLSKKN